MAWTACLARSLPRMLLRSIPAGRNNECSRSWKRETSVNLTFLLLRGFASNKQESYFSAIGGDSDEPPPDLTPEQVTAILRAGEYRCKKTSPLVTEIECNQLASNRPIEDRLKVTRIAKTDHSDELLLLAVFDGHGGCACADVVSSRLFHYIALSLSSDPAAFYTDFLEQKAGLKDIALSPQPGSATIYDPHSYHDIRVHVTRNESYYLSRFAQKLMKERPEKMQDKISEAFRQCDSDLSEEIRENLMNVKSNLLKHFYLSLAVSGCCANVIVVQDKNLFIANSGDCRAILTISDNDDENRCLPLSYDHNSDNVNELNRVFSQHPKKEQNNIIRYNRLLGQLMPLRAFGDFGYKWDVASIKAVGLTKAFGPHVIPPFYFTPPYLTCEPEILHYDLTQIPPTSESFIIMATDGLWEQFESSRLVAEHLWKHRHRIRGQMLENEDTIDSPSDPAKTHNFHLDDNTATFLLRTALCQPLSDHELNLDDSEQRRVDHKKLVSFLTLPDSVVRNFRDDISLIVIRI